MLEFLSFNLGLISSREIEEHKTYFDKEDLIALVGPMTVPIEMHHTYFEFGYNNLFVIKKKKKKSKKILFK